MSTKFLSAGVFTTEIDQSFLAAGVAGIGAAIMGRALKGPAFTPVIVHGFDQYTALFGPTDPTGSMQMPYAAKNYLQNAGTLTVIRVLGSADGLSINSGYRVGQEVAIVDNAGTQAGENQVMAVIHTISSGTFSVAGVSADAINFVVQLTSSLGLFAATASFVPSSANYITKVLNTNPALFNTYGHYLYRNDSYVTPGALAVSGSASWGVVSSPSGTFERDFNEGVTAWVKSQPVGGMDFNLFRLHTRGHGRATNDDIKVQISNIRPSVNPQSTPYGTFDVVIRNFYDTDQRPLAIETYINCNLNPQSPNYVARRIGDQLETFDTVQRKMLQVGNFPNKSQLIRIEMSTTSNPPQQALPWGHRGYAAQLWASGTGSLQDVPLPLVPNQVNQQGNIDASIVWGILNTNISGGIVDRMRAMPDAEVPTTGPGNAGASPAPSDPDFSLAYLNQSLLNGQPFWSYNASGPASTQPIYASSSLYAYTLPFQGGFDGWDLRNPDPTYLNNSDTIASAPSIPGSGNPQTGGGLVVASLNRATDTVANGDAFDMNLYAIPGINCLSVCDHARTMVNNRMDAMYVMDVTGSSVNAVIQNLQNRNLDDNYTACYYPDLKLNDTVSNLVVRVAPSVAVLGAMAYNDRVGQVFFAPAGLNRGGLNQFDIIDVVDRLAFTDRDQLYSNRINPIATFPNEGIVVWGQKTLQVRASALDRVNVRRLLIYAKKTVASAAKYLLFEPNNAQTWQRFLNLVNPILNKIQQDQGLNRFKVVMDSSTNPGTLTDQNIMTGKIFLQPTTAAEFIDLSFIITSSGVSFGS